MKIKNYNLVLMEDVTAVDRHGMNFMRKGTKGILVSQGEVSSLLKINDEIYELPNIVFKLEDNMIDKKVA